MATPANTSKLIFNIPRWSLFASNLMKSRPEKAGYHIVWNIQSSEILPSHDTSCMIFDADPKLIKGECTACRISFCSPDKGCVIKIILHHGESDFHRLNFANLWFRDETFKREWTLDRINEKCYEIYTPNSDFYINQLQNAYVTQGVEEYIPLPSLLSSSPPETVNSAELDRQIAMVTGNHSMILESTGGVSNYNKRSKPSVDTSLSKKSKL